MRERKERAIGSQPRTTDKIAREVKHDQTHPWSKGNTHPVKDAKDDQ